MGVGWGWWVGMVMSLTAYHAGHDSVVWLDNNFGAVFLALRQWQMSQQQCVDKCRSGTESRTV